MKTGLIAVGNLKGGVGKSTLAVNLACALGAYLIDADPQGSTWDWLGKGKLPIYGQHLPTLADWRALQEINAKLIVMDLPPAFGEQTKAALLVADLLLLPVTPSALDLKAALSMLELVKAARERRNKKLKCLLVPSRVDNRTAAGRELPEVLASLGQPVAPAVGQRVAFVDAHSAGQWVGDYAPNSTAHAEVLAIAERIKKL